MWWSRASQNTQSEGKIDKSDVNLIFPNNFRAKFDQSCTQKYFIAISSSLKKLYITITAQNLPKSL